MILKNGKIMAEEHAKTNIVDCVLTIPSNWNIAQRIGLFKAAVIAGLHPLALVHENVAAAVYYSLDRNDENKTHTVLIYNLGNDNAEVSIIEFYTENSTEKGKKPIEALKVVVENVDPRISGQKIDKKLAMHLASVFDSHPKRKGKVSILTKTSSMIKLMKEANKLKEQLSASKEIAGSIENLMEGEDFSYKIDRATLENIEKEIFDMVTQPIEKVLNDSKKTIEDIDSFQIVGKDNILTQMMM